MGASKAPWRLLWVSVLVCCVLLACDGVGKVRAESQEDSDLMFDSLDATNSKSRIARSSSFNSQESSQEVEDDQHWLSKTVNRIKRSIGNLFSKDEKLHESTHHGKVQTHQNVKKAQDEHKNVRKPRQFEESDYRDEADDPEGQGQVEYDENYDLDNGQQPDDEDIVINPGFTPPFPSFEEYEETPDEGPGIDDEDTDDFGSGKDRGSGEIETEVPTTTSSTQEILSLSYYRFTVAIGEFYLDYFKDGSSKEFQEVARRMEQGINELLSAGLKRGKRSCTVISIEQDKGEDFRSLVTFDIVSTVHDDEDEIKNRIYRQIEEKGTLGSYPAVTDGFSFLPFGESPPRCEESQISCLNRQCIQNTARCDGVRDCSDNSDEIDCPNVSEPSVPTVTVNQEQHPYVHPATVSEETTETRIPETTPTTTTSTTTTPEPDEDEDLGSGDDEEPRPTESPNRGDDINDCADGRGIYYGDQRCDGTPQCLDGSDEADCGPKCMVGEFSCDVHRCIPVSNRCDGFKQCDDGTDEQECDDCLRSPDSFRCDNNTVCLLSSRICDNVMDCRDGTDEKNCAGKLNY